MRIDTLTDIQALWQPDTAALVGLQDVGGIANPLLLAGWRTLWADLGGRQTALYDMLNIHYVVVKDGTPLPEDKFDLAFDAPGELAVYRNRTPLPRAWMVHEVQVVDTPVQAQAALQAAGFDPRQQAILVADHPTPPLAPATTPEPVAITAYGSNQIVLRVENSAPGLLMLSELWYPGWQATVNGRPEAVLQVNGFLRAVPVPSGQNTVRLRFTPFSWRLGLALFGIGCCLLLLFSFLRHSAKTLARA